MVDLKYITGFFPIHLKSDPRFIKHVLKEYVQLLVLDYLSSSSYIKNMVFIGGTNLRLIKGIERWSEDLDFDVKDMTESEFIAMTDSVIRFLRKNGFVVEAKDKASTKLSAFRRNIVFPHLLYDLKLSNHKEERFLLKIEAQDQGLEYTPQIANVEGCGFYFPLPVPPDEVLLAMKFSALLARAKGRDFYDVMFLMSQTKPDYDFLKKKVGIENGGQLKDSLLKKLEDVDLDVKKRDFQHLLFNDRGAEKILFFRDFINSKL